MRMRLGGAGTATVLAAALAVGGTVAVAAAAAPEARASAPCTDSTNISGARVYYQPANDSGIIKNLGDAGYQVTGTCNYYAHKDADGDHWYMQVYLGSGGYGYIWTQRLNDGSSHECDDNGTLQPIGSGSCPLTPYS